MSSNTPVVIGSCFIFARYLVRKKGGKVAAEETFGDMGAWGRVESHETLIVSMNLNEHSLTRTASFKDVTNSNDWNMTRPTAE
jgi:hypothetical protein